MRDVAFGAGNVVVLDHAIMPATLHEHPVRNTIAAPLDEVPDVVAGYAPSVGTHNVDGGDWRLRSPWAVVAKAVVLNQAVVRPFVRWMSVHLDMRIEVFQAVVSDDRTFGRPGYMKGVLAIVMHAACSFDDEIFKNPVRLGDVKSLNRA